MLDTPDNTILSLAAKSLKEAFEKANLPPQLNIHHVIAILEEEGFVVDRQIQVFQEDIE